MTGALSEWYTVKKYDALGKVMGAQGVEPALKYSGRAFAGLWAGLAEAALGALKTTR